MRNPAVARGHPRRACGREPATPSQPNHQTRRHRGDLARTHARSPLRRRPPRRAPVSVKSRLPPRNRRQPPRAARRAVSSSSRTEEPLTYARAQRNVPLPWLRRSASSSGEGKRITPPAMHVSAGRWVVRRRRRRHGPRVAPTCLSDRSALRRSCYPRRLACESPSPGMRCRACENGPGRWPGPGEPARLSAGVGLLLGGRDAMCRR
jgi:hypothetical protein